MIVSNKNMNLSNEEEIISTIVHNSNQIKEFVINAEKYHENFQKKFNFNPTERFVQVLGSAFTQTTVGRGLGMDENYLVTKVRPHFIGT